MFLISSRPLHEIAAQIGTILLTTAALEAHSPQVTRNNYSDSAITFASRQTLNSQITENNYDHIDFGLQPDAKRVFLQKNRAQELA